MEEELPCGSHSGAWAAAELSPSSGEVAPGQILLPAPCSQAMDTLVSAPSLLPVAFLTEQISAGY